VQTILHTALVQAHGTCAVSVGTCTVPTRSPALGGRCRRPTPRRRRGSRGRTRTRCCSWTGTRTGTVCARRRVKAAPARRLRHTTRHTLEAPTPQTRNSQGGPEFASWPSSLTESPYQSILKLAQSLGQPCEFYRAVIWHVYNATTPCGLCDSQTVSGHHFSRDGLTWHASAVEPYTNEYELLTPGDSTHGWPWAV
jgi:hypothetical protein